MVASAFSTPLGDVGEACHVHPAQVVTGEQVLPQTRTQTQCAESDEIVISGISGRFPESKDMNEFMENLLNGINMVTVNERRFKPGLYGIPKGFGTLREIDKFDADAFGMLPNAVRKTDPQLRMTLECVYEAMCDAGVNPADERGSRTGVFLGLCTAESLTLLSSDANRIDGQALIGCSNSMFANRVSYAYDFKGPSCAYDTACSTSAFAFEAAVNAMRTGRCDSAIVTASTLILTPTGGVQFDRLGMLAPDSACKSFDARGDGFARAEAVATIYLQRKSVARRVYASVLHIKTNTDGYKGAGITYPSAGMQEELLRSVYREAKINKNDVGYVEAHGTGTAAGDSQELLAISKTFQGRDRSLLVGSVKSNMGHAEGASGLCSIAKIVVMLQTGLIPKNLHYKEPAFVLNSIRNGKIQVVDKHTEWKGGLIALNSFGFGGVNVHMVLKAFEKAAGGPPDLAQAHLVLFSGRDESGVREALRKILAAKSENLWLLANDLCRSPNSIATVRGFAVYKPLAQQEPDTHGEQELEQSEILQVESTAAGGNPPPVWFVFNGIGSQWIGMCRDLLQLPIFARSIETSARSLREKFGFDLHALLASGDSDTYERPVNCFVGITACQIALIDVLTTVGVRPAGFLGHSAGEMACAYLDGCFSAEQAIVCAYLRGTSLEAESEPGAMAVVGMTWPQVERMCPPGVYPACHNGLDSVTVSASRPLLDAFIQDLREKKKGVTEVKSCGIAFHSPYIAQASRRFLGALRERPEFKPPSLARSTRWISTSVPETEWDSELAKMASPEYMVNNFLSPVLFYDALQQVPQGAVVVEVGPSGLLRGLVKRACPTATVIPLQARESNQGYVHLLTALGKIHVAGVTLDVNKLLGEETLPFPVPLGTPFLSPLIAGAWNHSTAWEVPYFGMNGSLQQTRYEIDMASEADSFLAGHVVQGRILFPATGYLVLVWKHFALTRQLHHEQCPVVFENVRFNRVTVLGRRDRVEFKIHISELSGAFEVKEGGAVVASGTVRAPDCNPGATEFRMDDAEFGDLHTSKLVEFNSKETHDHQLLNGTELYKRFRFYGFEYSGAFRGIQRADASLSSALVAWGGNWIAFLDTLLQAHIHPFAPAPSVKLPTSITKLVVDPGKFRAYATGDPDSEGSSGDGLKSPGGATVLLLRDPDLGLVKCHGIEMHWPKMTTVARRGKEARPELCSSKFTAYFDDPDEVDEDAMSPMLLCVSIAMENLPNQFMEPGFKMTVIEASPTEAGLEESVAVDKLIRLGFGVTDMGYTIFAGHNSEETTDAQAGGALGGILAHSGIDLKNFDEFHKDTWLDKTYDLIILHNHVFLVVIAGQYLRRGKFLALKLRRGEQVTVEELEEKIGPKMHVVTVKRDSQHVVYLIRKRSKAWDGHEINAKAEPPELVHISSNCTGWVPQLRDAVRRQEELKSKSQASGRKRVYLVGGAESGIRGLIACLRKEPHSENFRVILHQSADETLLDFDNPSPQLARILRHDLIVNVLDERARWGSYQSCAPLCGAGKSLTRRVESAFIGMGAIGDLSTFRWIEGLNFGNMNLQQGSVPVDVHFAALNFKDIMLATGSLPPPDASPVCSTVMESPLGLEFSSLTTDGRRVFGYNEGQSIATKVLANAAQLWEVPSTWSLAEASTVPVVYATAYLALIERGRLRRGETVLIHSGAGGVGQAAIRIALGAGATVFTTVGSPEKREFLRATFPQIPSAHVGNSRDSSFENLVLRLTKGRGVDLVLNSLTGEKLEASVRCLARHGRFLEIGKFDLVANKALGMELFLKDASFHGVMLDSLWDASDPGLAGRLKVLVQQGIESGIVQPLQARVFQVEQVEPAFRYMGTGKHVGKVIIQVRKEEGAHTGEKVPVLMDACPRVYFNPPCSYIVVGGLGGIGLEFVNWMITRNARRIVVVSRSGVTTAYQTEYIRAWREHQGAKVKIVQLDASKFEEAKALLAQASAMGRVDGFFNLAMQLELGFMRDQTESAFETVFASKVKLTRNMDILTREMCPSMSHFVVFSSVIASVGMPGQCNYGMANSSAEGICEQRVHDGLAGKAIELGPISEVGHFQEMYRTGREDSRNSYGGFGVQSIGSVLRAMDVLLTASEPVVMSRVNRELNTSRGAGGGGAGDTLVDRLTHILGTDVSKLNPKTKLTELGLDSIMAMEVRQVLEQEFGLNLSATEIRTITLEELFEQSKNSDKNVINPSRTKPRARAATAELFQFNFMRNSKKARILYRQCVHPLNKSAESAETGPGLDHGTVFICNSVEGPHILRILGSLIRRPAYSMQLPEEAPLESLEAFVDYYLRELKATRPNGPYILAGYSAGALIAIELALRLQALGDDVRQLVLIDLTPGRADALLDENFGSDRAKLDETHVLIAMLSQVLNIDKAHAEAVLTALPDRASRIEKAAELGAALFDEDVDFKTLDKLLGESQLKIINFFNRYKPSGTWNGKVSLVRTTQNLISYDSNEYWGLEEFCSQTPRVHVIESTHSYLVAEPGVHKVAAVINDH